MKRRSEPEAGWDQLRDKILGLGDQSIHKSHYPELQRRLSELAESEERYRTLVQSVNVGISQSTVEMPGRFLEANPAALSIFGFETLDELRRAPIASLYVYAQERADLMEELARTGSVNHRELKMRHKDGHTLWIVWSAVRHVNPRGEATVHAVFEDVTARKRLEAELVHAQKMDAIGRLAGGVAHDFNNLLSVIIGNGDLLLRELGESSEQREYAEEIYAAAGRAAEVVRQLLAFSRKQELVPRVLDLNHLVAGTEKLLRRLIGERIRLRTVLSPAIGRVRADPAQLEQVLVNLVVNARDAMPNGGELTVSTEATPKETEDCRLEGKRVVHLVVCDTGEGMDEATRARIFEPFFTTKPEGRGTGLGLSTVYGIAQQSGGCVCVKSALGKGSVFTVCLPELDPAEEEAELDGPAASAPGRGERVLVVEDEQTVRRVLVRVLCDAGYQVLEAADGAQALELEAGLRGGRLDLLLSDVVMPGQTGPELAVELRRRRPDLKVLFVTGYSENPPGTKAPVLHKPFRAGELLAAVRGALA